VPENLNRNDSTFSETGKQPVMLLTVSFVVCLVYGILTPGVEGIEALCQGLADGPCLAAIEQDWKDVGLVEVHLSV